MQAVYALLVLLALAPGVVTALGFQLPAGTRAGELHAMVRAELQRIEFGSGWRFWFGVIGTAMMALLLLYPVRKLFGAGRRISVAKWFHLHILLGLLGPVLILYHCNFGTGSLRANVALFTMLVVVLSGLIGHYLYAWLSQEFYGELRTAAELLGEAKLALAELGPSPSLKSLIEDLDAFDADAQTSRPGIGATLRLRKHRSRLLQHAEWLISSQRRGNAWTASYRGRINSLMAAYFTSALRATRRSVSEQIGRLWRLLHLPLFAVTVVAIGAHVYAVWGIDSAPATTAPSPPAMVQELPTAPPPVSSPSPAQAPSSAAAPAPAGSNIIAQRQKQSIAITPSGTVAAAPSNGSKPIAGSNSQADPIGALLSGTPEPVIIPPLPREVTRRPARAPIVEQSEAVAGSDNRLPSTAARSEVPAQPKAPNAGPVVTAQPKPAAVGPANPVAAAPAPPVPSAEQIDPAVAELAKRSAATEAPSIDPVSKALSIADRLRGFKQLNFDHSKTRFPLTGKHVTVSCEKCHVTTIENTPITCISCHKKDDVHRGRRPVCESCHVTTNWTRIVRRRGT